MLSFCLSVAALLPASAVAAPVNLHVSPEGNDAWTGRSAEAKAPDGPVKTLAAAREAVRKLKTGGQLAMLPCLRRGGHFPYWRWYSSIARRRTASLSGFGRSSGRGFPCSSCSNGFPGGR